MCEVQEIIGNQQKISGKSLVSGPRAPRRMIDRVKVRDLCLIGERRIAGPDPDQARALDDGITAHAGARGYAALSRDLYATSARIEFETMIHAADTVTFFTAQGQRCASVAASILKRRRLA